MEAIDHRERLATLACPTLIMHARHDRKQLYEGAAYMTRVMRNARLVTLEQSAHMAQVVELDLFNQALASFLRSLQAGGGFT